MDAEEYAQEYLCSFDSALKGAIYATEVNELFRTAGASHRHRHQPSLRPRPRHPLRLRPGVHRRHGAHRLPVATPHRPCPHRQRTRPVRRGHLHPHRRPALRSRDRIGNIHLPHDARARNLQTGKSIVEQFIAEGYHAAAWCPTITCMTASSACAGSFPGWCSDNPCPLDGRASGAADEFIEAMKSYHREWDEDNLCFKEQPVHDWSIGLHGRAALPRHRRREYFPSGRSSRQRPTVRPRRGAPGLWSPHVGYNLETLLRRQASSTKRGHAMTTPSPSSPSPDGSIEKPQDLSPRKLWELEIEAAEKELREVPQARRRRHRSVPRRARRHQADMQVVQRLLREHEHPGVGAVRRPARSPPSRAATMTIGIRWPGSRRSSSSAPSRRTWTTLPTSSTRSCASACRTG